VSPVTTRRISPPEQMLPGYPPGISFKGVPRKFEQLTLPKEQRPVGRECYGQAGYLPHGLNGTIAHFLGVSTEIQSLVDGSSAA